MLRYLRFAPAVAFALLALAFVGLWVRSYRYFDRVQLSGSGYEVQSMRGRVGLFSWPQRESSHRELVWFPYRLEASEEFDWPKQSRSGFGFGVIDSGSTSAFIVPHWFLALSSIALAALLAFKPVTRFTVRGLLITTTLLAAVLGLAVYAV